MPAEIGNTEARLVSEAKRVIDRIARAPRFAGSAGESEAREFCAAELRAAGLQITEREFEFSEWPGRWGIPLIAGWVLTAILSIAAVSAALPRASGLPGLVMMVAITPLMVGAKRRQRATAAMPWLRSRAKNVEATRGTPSVWLVAHLDSKSQTVPMLLRVISHIALLSVAVLTVAAMFLLQWTVIVSVPWTWFAAVALVAAAPSLLCFVRNASPGALDNATGVAAVILAARVIPKERSVGVLLTSGEELDLAGARAWNERASKGAMMINCDTVDDTGGWRWMYRFRPHRLGLAVETAAKQLGLHLKGGQMIPGILTDSLAFEAAGLPAVTISRGTLGTLARLHTAGDNSERITGTGAATAARLLATMVEELS